MSGDIFYSLIWWVMLFGLGMLFLPLTITIFHKFFDLGYAFSKIIGLLLLSYLVWLLGSLQLLPFTVWAIFLVVGLYLSFILYLTYKGKFLAVPFDKLKVFLAEELLFLVAFLFWAYVRAHEPSLHGLEKFMDFGFINSILRSTYFPPADIWMTPLSINYYYFGHLVTAVLIKASGVYPPLGYNLMLATLFALTATASFSLGGNLYHLSNRWRRLTLFSGFLSSFLVTLGGNLQTIYAFFQNYPDPEKPVPFWTLQPMFNFLSYWYPNATRFIPLTIHEFPIYSFVVADLHGHVLNIPFVLLLIALGIKIFHQTKLFWFDYLLTGLLIGTSLMTNVLDGPIYLLFFTILLLVKNLAQGKLNQALMTTVKLIAYITLLAMIFSLPYWLLFTPFAQGVGVLCAPQFLIDRGSLGPFLFEANHCTRSPLWMLAILWGFPYFVFFGFLSLIVNKFYPLSTIFKKPSSILHLPSSDFLALTFILIATVLILIPEFFYAKDIYPAHYRANTVFKFGYQAFIILALTSGYMITRILSFSRKAFWFLVIGIWLFALVALYPYFAINSYYGELKTYRGLDGISYLNDLYPTDYQAILWLNQNVAGQPVILEAQGDSYTDFGRISANTGLPTVIGWPVHEWLWRGSYDEAGKRSGEVTQIYESTDLNLTRQLLTQHNVSYVFIGALERQKYPNLNEEKFTKLGKVVFQSGNTQIYQLDQSVR